MSDSIILTIRRAGIEGARVHSQWKVLNAPVADNAKHRLELVTETTPAPVIEVDDLDIARHFWAASYMRELRWHRRSSQLPHVVPSVP